MTYCDWMDQIQNRNKLVWPAQTLLAGFVVVVFHNGNIFLNVRMLPLCNEYFMNPNQSPIPELIIVLFYCHFITFRKGQSFPKELESIVTTFTELSPFWEYVGIV